MDVLELTRSLAKSLQESDEYKNYRKSEMESDNNEELQLSIKKFNDIKTDLDILRTSENRDEEKMKQLNEELRKVYDKVINDPYMIKFNESKSLVDDMMDKVNFILTSALNGENVDEIDLKNITKLSGGCCGSGGCSGCSCK